MLQSLHMTETKEAMEKCVMHLDLTQVNQQMCLQWMPILVGLPRQYSWIRNSSQNSCSRLQPLTMAVPNTLLAQPFILSSWTIMIIHQSLQTDTTSLQVSAHYRIFRRGLCYYNVIQYNMNLKIQGNSFKVLRIINLFKDEFMFHGMSLNIQKEFQNTRSSTIVLCLKNREFAFKFPGVTLKVFIRNKIKD